MSSNPAAKQYKALGEDVWKTKVDKIVSELFILSKSNRVLRA
jgi:hypothetical protein